MCTGERAHAHVLRSGVRACLCGQEREGEVDVDSGVKAIACGHEGRYQHIEESAQVPVENRRRAADEHSGGYARYAGVIVQE